MDCREFRNKHSLLVDLRCSAVEEHEMRRHMQACPGCSHHDTRVRRGLMLIRSLPQIEPSPQFRARLDARLRTSPRLAATPFRPWYASTGGYFAIAAGVAFVAYLATASIRSVSPSEVLHPPAVATLPEHEPSPVATAALVATVPTGMSVWPAIMVATQAPMHFVAAEMANER